MTDFSWRGFTPGFLIGLALAMVGEVAAGLLLYGGPGFLPALSVVLAVLFISLGVGLASDDGSRGRVAVEAARRRWFHALVAFALAAGFSAGWEVFRGFGAAGLSQAIGLAALVAFPFYTGGRVLGGLAGLPGGRGRVRVAGSALFGGAFGVLAVGFLFFPTLSPTAVILLALVSVSGGALVHGWALDEVFWVDASERFTGPGGLWKVERWMRGNPRTARLAIRENGRLRALVDSEGTPVTAEERAIRDWVAAVGGARGRMLSLGIGGAVLGELLGHGSEPPEHWVASVDPSATERIMSGMDRFLGRNDPARSDHLRHLDLDPAVLLHHGASPIEPGSLDWILLDTLAIAATPGGVRFPPDGLQRLRTLLRPGGVLLVFPLLEVSGGRDLLSSILEPSEAFENASLYVGGRHDAAGIEIPEGRGFPRHPAPGGARGAFLVGAVGTEAMDAEWPEAVAGFLRVPRESPADRPRCS